MLDAVRLRLYVLALCLLVPVTAYAQPSVTSLTLIDADTDQPIRDLSPIDALQVYELPTSNLSIRANVDGAPGSVRFAFAGQPNYQTENVVPYALGGDQNGNYAPVAELAQDGSYTLTATPFTGSNGGGTAGTPLTVQLTVYTEDPSPGGGPAITGFALYNADTGQQIRNFEGTDAIDLAELPTSNLSIVAFTAGGAESVQFSFAGDASYQTANAPPYALAGTNSGAFNPVPELAQPGSYTVVATPYTGDDASGAAGETGTLQLTVTDSTPPSGGPAITGFALYNADTNQQIRNFEGTDAIDLAELPTSNLSIVAFTAGGAESVQFSFAGQTNYQTENNEPYALAGDSNGDYDPVPELAQPGSYTVVATPYTGNNASGTAGEAGTLQLTVTDGTPDDPADCPPGDGSYTVDGPRDANGQFMAWHPITITLDWVCASEEGSPNPYLDYRLDVEVVNYDGGASFRVPGYFAADGDAANTGATTGRKWRAHLVLAPGTYAVDFETYASPGVAIADDPGTPGGAGTAIVVAPSDKCTGSGACRDNRGKGPLRYVGERYLRFDNGEYFLKGGADSPENLLAYVDFDDTFDTNGQAKTWGAHVQDWNPGDPTWQGDKGKGLIGALNYLAAEGMNAFSFLPFNNPQGDGKDVWPWTTPGQTAASRLRYDVSKLAQWEIVFTHADSLGLFLHFKTQETENDQLLDGGELGTQRKLYYRELVARFGHHLALNWNLGEENDLWQELNDPDQTRVKAHAAYLAELDPYDHPIVIHSYPGQDDEVYGPLVGDSELTGASIQLSGMSGGHAKTLKWLNEAEAAGKPWHVAIDEPGNAGTGVTCDGPGNNHAAAREEALWANLMAGGTGVEWYFGYQTCAGDLAAEDWRTRDRLWDYTRHALTFFRDYLPFWEMESADALTPTSGAYVFAKPDELYAVYAPDAGSVSLALPSGSYAVQWYDPRDGGALQTGSVAAVDGGGTRALGTPPYDAGQDWVALVTRDGDGGGGDGPGAGDVVFAVNAGGGAFTAADGTAYVADGGASGGKTYSTNDAISGTADDALYQSERYGNFSYAIPVANGTYDVTLQLAEIYWTAVGQRQFDVLAEGTPVVSDLDLYAQAGHDAAYDVTASVTVADGTLDLSFVTDVNNAKVAAIVVQAADGAGNKLAEADAAPEGLTSDVYPNPFNPQATIRYALPEAAHVRLEVFDLLGRRVALLVDAAQTAGSHTARFDGSALPSGTYLYRLQAGAHVEVRQLTLLK